MENVKNKKPIMVGGILLETVLKRIDQALFCFNFSHIRSIEK